MYYSTKYLINTWYSENLEPHIRKLFIFVLTWVSPALIFGQIITNFLYLQFESFYFLHADTLAWLFGLNLFYAFGFIALSGLFKFCRFARWSAWCEMVLAVSYKVAGSANAYNHTLLWVQIAIGLFALIMTFRSFVKAYPNCRLSRVRYFIKLIFATASCTGALDKYLHNFEITEKKKINAGKY